MPYLALDEQRLFYAHRPGAPPQTPSVVLLHGAGGSRLDWPAAVRQLPGASVFALDLPGHGRSDPPGRESVAAYAEAVRAFVQRLALQKLVLVGHSLGGAIAQEIALDPPPALAGLILIATGARLRVTDAILDEIESNFAGAAETITALAWAKGRPDELADGGRKRLLENDPSLVHGDFKACDAFDVMARLPEIATPTLVVNGDADRLTPLKYARYLGDRLPNGRLVIVEGAGHMVALERPEAVAAAMAEFIASLS